MINLQSQNRTDIRSSYGSVITQLDNDVTKTSGRVGKLYPNEKDTLSAIFSYQVPKSHIFEFDTDTKFMLELFGEDRKLLDGYYNIRILNKKTTCCREIISSGNISKFGYGYYTYAELVCLKPVTYDKNFQVIGEQFIEINVKSTKILIPEISKIELPFITYIL